MAEADGQRRVDALHGALERHHDGLALGLRSILVVASELGRKDEVSPIVCGLTQGEVVTQELFHRRVNQQLLLGLLLDLMLCRNREAAGQHILLEA